MRFSKEQPKSKNWLSRLYYWFGLTDETTIKVYHGYGHTQKLIVYGHVFKLSPLPRTKYTKSVLKNTLALLRLFFVKPVAGALVQLTWKGHTHTAKSDKDGFFKFEWKDDHLDQTGWQEVFVTMQLKDGSQIQSKGSVYIPYETQYGFISDIDDTFLISHSVNMRKRLYVLFTQNARSRLPFEGAVRHYQLLAKGNTSPDTPNPFFFVSSSEWNLYDYILEFTTVNGIPRGVFLLNVVKQLHELLKTGQSNHHTKFIRIVRILETYPDQRFILLGDSSQQDPYIYASIVEHFPKRIHAVYIRDVYAKNKEKVKDVLYKIESAGVSCCFFQHSSEAILHSRKIGLISEVAADEAIRKEIV